MRNIKIKKIFILVAIIAINFSVNAQVPPNPDSPGGGDPGTFPIGDYVPLLVIAALGLAFYSIKRFQITDNR